MPSLYSIIKNDYVSQQGGRTIETKTDFKTTEKKENENKENYYVNTAEAIIGSANKTKDEILRKAYEDAQNIAKDAYAKGYENGKQKGYKDSYEINIKKANDEAQKIKKDADEKADNILKSARKEYVKYLEDKQGEIKELIISAIESVFKEKFYDDSNIEKFIEDVVDKERNVKVFIIKCNEKHVDYLKSNVDKIKKSKAFKGDIFVIADNSIKIGNILIEKDNGKIYMGIETALKRVENIIKGND